MKNPNLIGLSNVRPLLSGVLSVFEPSQARLLANKLHEQGSVPGTRLFFTIFLLLGLYVTVTSDRGFDGLPAIAFIWKNG
jgi:hypothetical protein